MISRNKDHNIKGTQHHHIVPEQIWKSDKRENAKDDLRAKFEKTNEFLRKVGFTDKELDHYIKVLPRDWKNDPVFQGSTHRGPHHAYTEDCSDRINRIALEARKQGLDAEQAKEMVHRELVQLKQELRFEDIKLNGALPKNQPQPELEPAPAPAPEPALAPEPEAEQAEPGGVKTAIEAFAGIDTNHSEIKFRYHDLALSHGHKFHKDLGYISPELVVEAGMIALADLDCGPCISFESDEGSRGFDCYNCEPATFIDDTHSIKVETNVPNTALAELFTHMDLNLKRFTLAVYCSFLLKDGVSDQTEVFSSYENRWLPSGKGYEVGNKYMKSTQYRPEKIFGDSAIGTNINFGYFSYFQDDSEISIDPFFEIRTYKKDDPSVRISCFDSKQEHPLAEELFDIWKAFNNDIALSDIVTATNVALSLIALQKSFIRDGKFLLSKEEFNMEKLNYPITPTTLPPLLVPFTRYLYGIPINRASDIEKVAEISREKGCDLSEEGRDARYFLKATDGHSPCITELVFGGCNSSFTGVIDPHVRNHTNQEMGLNVVALDPEFKASLLKMFADKTKKTGPAKFIVQESNRCTAPVNAFVDEITPEQIKMAHAIFYGNCDELVKRDYQKDGINVSTFTNLDIEKLPKEEYFSEFDKLKMDFVTTPRIYGLIHSYRIKIAQILKDALTKIQYDQIHKYHKAAFCDRVKPTAT